MQWTLDRNNCTLKVDLTLGYSSFENKIYELTGLSTFTHLITKHISLDVSYKAQETQLIHCVLPGGGSHTQWIRHIRNTSTVFYHWIFSGSNEWLKHLALKEGKTVPLFQARGKVFRYIEVWNKLLERWSRHKF